MSRKLELRLPRRRANPEVRRDGETYSQDFAFLVLDDDDSRWEQFKARILYKLGRIRPPR